MPWTREELQNPEVRKNAVRKTLDALLDLVELAGFGVQRQRAGGAVAAISDCAKWLDARVSREDTRNAVREAYELSRGGGRPEGAALVISTLERAHRAFERALSRDDNTVDWRQPVESAGYEAWIADEERWKWLEGDWDLDRFYEDLKQKAGSWQVALRYYAVGIAQSINERYLHERGFMDGRPRPSFRKACEAAASRGQFLLPRGLDQAIKVRNSAIHGSEEPPACVQAVEAQYELFRSLRTAQLDAAPLVERAAPEPSPPEPSPPSCTHTSDAASTNTRPRVMAAPSDSYWLEAIFALGMLFLAFLGVVGSASTSTDTRQKTGSIGAPASVSFQFPPHRFRNHSSCQVVTTSIPKGMAPSDVGCVLGGFPEDANIEASCRRVSSAESNTDGTKVEWSICLDVAPCCSELEASGRQQFVGFFPNDKYESSAAVCSHLVTSIPQNTLGCWAPRVGGAISIVGGILWLWCKRHRLVPVFNSLAGCFLVMGVIFAGLVSFFVWLASSPAIRVPITASDKGCQWARQSSGVGPALAVPSATTLGTSGPILPSAAPRSP